MGLFESHLRGEAGAFFPLHPGSADDRRRAVRAAVRPLAPAVAEELERQNARHPGEARAAHLAALRQGAAAVVTGQQVGLFLGPLYTLYKAATAIVNARALAEETGVPVVPIFWLQVEDHDLPEIAGCTIPDRDGGLATFALPADDGRVSIAHRALPAAVEREVARLRDELEELPFGGEHLARIARHYRPGAGWGEAFAGLLAELFEELVLVDPRTPALAAAAAPVHRRALAEAEAIATALRGRCRELEAAGYPVAVHVREGAPLSFFHPEGREGPRFRLDADLAEVGGSGRHSLAELLAALERDPLAFSTSALLRPIVQDTLLPTAAYVGGPGEIAYFAQLAPLYDHFDRPMPLIAPRARFRVIEGRARRILERHHLSPDDAAGGEAALLARLAAGDLPDAGSYGARLLEGVEEVLREIAAGPLGADLGKSLGRTERSIRIAVERFTRRYEAARLRRDGRLVEEVRRLVRLLHPGAPQERIHGLPWYAARYGERSFVQAVLDAVVPFDATLRDLHP